jgi:hypothetical protein
MIRSSIIMLGVVRLSASLLTAAFLVACTNAPA